MEATQTPKRTYYQSNELNLSDIAPNKGMKYSPNLYKFLVKNNSMARFSQLFVARDGTQWLGFLDDQGSFIGQRLMQILCNGAKVQTFCFIRDEGRVLQPNFWAEYVRDGRCAIDRSHENVFLGDSSRWTTQGETRSCLWCGNAQQTLRKWTEAVVRSEWKTNPPA